MRPFAEHDLKTFRLALEGAASVRFEERLDTVAKGGIRWTLPVLVGKEDGRMLAAVSLGVGLQEVEGRVEWEVRYRAVSRSESGGRGRGSGREGKRRKGGVERRGGKSKEEVGGEGDEEGRSRSGEEQEREVIERETESGDETKGSVVRQYWL